MSEPFASEIRIVSFNFAPKGWAMCNGQILTINQNQQLFSLLGTTYGGNGQTTFALPDLRGRIPIHFKGTGVFSTLGVKGGEEAHTLTQTEMPAHTHVPSAYSGNPNSPDPTGNVWAKSTLQPYRVDKLDSTMNPASVTSAGGSQSHYNMPPYLTLTFIIALQGIFPSRPRA